MSAPDFTVLLPVNRSPAMLPFAIESVLAQERRDFELMVICDGAPPETAAVAKRYAAEDSRIQVFEHSKGERHGEVYRDQALRQARGRFVCHIGDDDLWLPHHLDEMSRLLEDADFGCLSQVEIGPDGTAQVLPGDLANPRVRQKMLTERFNFFGPTVAGYRIEAYRALPVGWSAAPDDLPTDLFMWRKFLARELRFGSRVAVTSVKFSANARREWPLEQRRAEVMEWAVRLSDREARDRITQAALCLLSQSTLDLQHGVQGLRKAAEKKSERIAALENQVRQLKERLEKTRRSLSWRITRPFRKLARRLARLRGR